MRSARDEVSVLFGGERLYLLRERAVWLPRFDSLLIADVHFGKELVFRREGIPIPDGPSAADLDRLQLLCASTGVRHLWILGDLVHGQLGPLQTALLHGWLTGLDDVQVHLIEGNHDRHSKNELAGLPISRHPGYQLGSLWLSHEPTASAHGDHTICGHVHPVAQVRIGRHRPVRTQIFAIASHEITLPAFGQFTGGHLIPGADNLDRYAILGDQVVLLPA